MRFPLLLLFIALIAGCGTNERKDANNTPPPSQTGYRPATDSASYLFTAMDATAILGVSCHTVDSLWSHDTGVTRLNTGYKANERDTQTGDTGAVYFVFENYDDTNAAHKRYIFIRDANKNGGITELTDLGDEAYYHTDNTHFRFIMARKNNKVIVMKINKLTAHTSDSVFRAIAHRVVTSM